MKMVVALTMLSLKLPAPPASNVHFCSVLSNVWHAICAQLMLATS